MNRRIRRGGKKFHWILSWAMTYYLFKQGEATVQHILSFEYVAKVHPIYFPRMYCFSKISGQGSISLFSTFLVQMNVRCLFFFIHLKITKCRAIISLVNRCGFLNSSYSYMMTFTNVDFNLKSRCSPAYGEQGMLVVLVALAIVWSLLISHL